jgi:energy-coupling factor transporter ATP-binding protein EcfA2
MSDALLELRGLTVDFATDDGVVHAVDGIDLALGRGRTLGLVGESGCGKSVTSLAIMGLLPPENSKVGGAVVFEGRDLLTLDAHLLRDLRGARHRDDLPGADDLAEPGLHDRRPDHRGDPAPPARPSTAARGARAIEMLRWCASRRPSSASTSIRTSSPAACASAR